MSHKLMANRIIGLSERSKQSHTYSAFYLVWPLLQFLNLMNIFTRRMKSRGVTKLNCCKLLAR